MKRCKQLGGALGAGVLLAGLAGCQGTTNNPVVPLTDYYYLVTDHRGASGLYCGGRWGGHPPRLLAGLDSVGVATPFLVARQATAGPGRYYLLPLAAEATAAARAGLRGPYTRAACRHQLTLVRGDSILQLTPAR